MLTRFVTALLYIACIVLVGAIGLWLIGMFVTVPAEIVKILYVILVLLILLAILGAVTGKFPPPGWPGAL